MLRDTHLLLMGTLLLQAQAEAAAAAQLRERNKQTLVTALKVGSHYCHQSIPAGGAYAPEC